MKNLTDLKFALYRYGECVKIFFRDIAPKCDPTMIAAITEMFREHIDLPKVIEQREDVYGDMSAIVIDVNLYHTHKYSYGRRHTKYTYKVIICSREELSAFIHSVKAMSGDDTWILIDKFVYYTDNHIYMPYVEQECGYTIITLDRNLEL